MKRFLVVIFAMFLYGCSVTAVVSPEDVSKEVLSKIPGIEKVYLFPSTETEYVYILSTNDGFIVIVHIEKVPPHKITKSGILFQCICEKQEHVTENKK